MKKIIILLAGYCCYGLAASGQVKIYPSPEAGFEGRIHQAVYDLRIIDSHEHLMSEKQSATLSGDIGCLFNNYQCSDLISSGSESTGKELEDCMRNPALSPDVKWDMIKDHWDHVKVTGYGRMVSIAARDLFGITELNENTYKELSMRIAKLRERKDYYEYVLKTKAKIDLSILVGYNDDPAKQDALYFKSLYWSDEIYLLNSYRQIASLCKNAGQLPVETLSGYEQIIDTIIHRQLFVKGAIGLKVMMAYKRTLQCDAVPREKAMEIFEKLQGNKRDELAFDEVKPLQDYLLFYVFSKCNQYKLPVQIHTGLQTFNGNYITNSNPTGLTEAFFKFPEVRFALLHAAYPYGGELAALAKNFPNVFIDLAWSASISPSYTQRYIQEFLETVPNNKIVAFGGDCHTPEGVYAASVMARETVENTLIVMVRSGYISEKEAMVIIEKLLRTNAIEIYGLKNFLNQ
ncbi:MAG: amidohydrolase family protein [Mangrovibacterium sp.]